MRRVFLPLIVLVIVIPYLSGKDVPFQVVSWPESGQPALRFTFSKFKEMGGMGREHTYVTDTNRGEPLGQDHRERNFLSLRLR